MSLLIILLIILELIIFVILIGALFFLFLIWLIKDEEIPRYYGYEGIDYRKNGI